MGGALRPPEADKEGTSDRFGFWAHSSKICSPPLSKELLLKAIERTAERVEAIYVDWKGSKGETRQMAKMVAEELGLEFIKD